MSKETLLDKITKHRNTKYWASGYAKGYVTGSRESTDFLRQMIIKNLLNDAVMTTNADTFIVERIVEIIEES
jgi:hypothetical protein